MRVLVRCLKFDCNNFEINIFDIRLVIPSQTYIHPNYHQEHPFMNNVAIIEVSVHWTHLILFLKSIFSDHRHV